MSDKPIYDMPEMRVAMMRLYFWTRVYEMTFESQLRHGSVSMALSSAGSASEAAMRHFDAFWERTRPQVAR